MTYLVMECHPAYAIVLDQAGRMLKVANMGYQEGQIVDSVIARRFRPLPLYKRLAPLAAAACLCVALLGGGAYGAYFIPYGTVRLKINPEVRMSISYMNRIVGLEGLNEDGVRLIEQIPYRGKKSEELTGILVKRAVDLGYLSDGGTVSVTAKGGSVRWEEKRASAIDSSLNELLEGRVTVEIRPGYPAAAPVTPEPTGQGRQEILEEREDGEEEEKEDPEADPEEDERKAGDEKDEEDEDGAEDADGRPGERQEDDGEDADDRDQRGPGTSNPDETSGKGGAEDEASEDVREEEEDLETEEPEEEDVPEPDDGREDGIDESEDVEHGEEGGPGSDGGIDDLQMDEPEEEDGDNEDENDRKEDDD